MLTWSYFRDSFVDRITPREERPHHRKLVKGSTFIESSALNAVRGCLTCETQERKCTRIPEGDARS